jgi:hypothetical protein
MKEELSISPKHIYIILSTLALIAIVGILFLIRNSVKYNNELEILRSKEIKGVIVKLRDTGRGFCSMEIKEPNDSTNEYSLAIAWEVKEFNIQAGDSVYKESSSKIMTFYKMKNGSYEKRCVYEM